MAARPEAARPEKVAVVDEVKESLDAAIATILTDYRGLSVGELAELRTELRKTNATYKVAKNTLMRRAAADAEVDIEDLLVGPTALVFCEDDPVGPAKALKAFAKDHPELLVKGSWFDGERLDAEATVKLADLQSRDELLERLAGLMYGALANTARLLNAAPTKLAQLMSALEAEGGPQAKGFEPTEPAEAPAAADDEASAEQPAADGDAAPAADAASDDADAPSADADADAPSADADADAPSADADTDADDGAEDEADDTQASTDDAEADDDDAEASTDDTETDADDADDETEQA